MNEEEKIREIFKRLNEVYTVRTFLDHDPYKVLIRTILSQRTRDENTDQATNNLFEKYPDIYAVVDAPIDDVKELIRPAGFYNVKAGRIKEVSQILIDQYGGEVPNTVEEMIKLPGVGRKTANVVWANAFGGDAIAVDTHVFRVSNRLGLADAKDVDKTEQQLQKAIPQCDWSLAHHWIIFHGRRVCSARTPKCESCTLNTLCKYYESLKKPE